MVIQLSTILEFNIAESQLNPTATRGFATSTHGLNASGVIPVSILHFIARD
jgi:hypothetical protein